MKAELKHLPIYFGACLAVFLFGGLFQPGDWYTSLNRAPWSPPNIAFPIVWSILYIMIAVSGWLIFATDNSQLKRLWIIQLILNAIWSWLFFGQQWLLIGLIDIVALALCVLMMVVVSWRAKLKLVSLLLIPYLIWLLLASSLNTYIVLNN